MDDSEATKKETKTKLGLERPFGITDIIPRLVETPPVFTEQATLNAMADLHVSPQDIAIAKCNNIEDTVSMEMRRLKLIEQIMERRSEILGDNKIASKKKLKKQQKGKRVAKSSTRMVYPRPIDSDVFVPVQPSARSSKPDSPQSTEAKLRRVQKLQEQEKLNHELEIKKRAQLRMKKIQEEEQVMKKKKDQLKKKQMQEELKMEKKINKALGKKTKKYDNQQKWREANIYGLKLKKKKPLKPIPK